MGYLREGMSREVFRTGISGGISLDVLGGNVWNSREGLWGFSEGIVEESPGVIYGF